MFSTRFCVGSLAFVIYINDICNSSDPISFCLFADDTSLLYSHNNVDAAIQNLNLELHKISTWLLANKLCINVLKYNIVRFCANQYKYIQSIPLVLNGINLNQLKVTTFLGIYIDEHLTWKNHIKDVSIKISKHIGIMNRFKFFLPSNILLTIYNFFVLPYLTIAFSFGGVLQLSVTNYLLYKSGLFESFLMLVIRIIQLHFLNNLNF